jgi:hypothetical protein
VAQWPRTTPPGHAEPLLAGEHRRRHQPSIALGESTCPCLPVLEELGGKPRTPRAGGRGAERAPPATLPSTIRSTLVRMSPAGSSADRRG